jgi:hypothetical protein
MRIAPAEAADLPPFDLLYAGFSLSFLEPAVLRGLWARVLAAQRPGGHVVVNVFGVHDTWAGKPGMTFIDLDGARRLVDGLDVVVLDEIEEDGGSFVGPKHWHLFDIVARRPPEGP